MKYIAGIYRTKIHSKSTRYDKIEKIKIKITRKGIWKSMETEMNWQKAIELSFHLL